MTRYLASMVCLAGALAAGGCLFAEPEEGDSSTVFVPADAIEIVEGIHLLNARPTSDPLPAATGAGAPVIEASNFQNTGPNSFVVVVDVSGSPVDEMVVEINGQLYVVDVELLAGGDVASLDACELVASARGYECTQACLEACGCVSCSDATTENHVEGSCAATCSIADAEGALDGAPYEGSEEIFADATYNGYTTDSGAHVPGALDGLSCDASACASAASEAKASSYSFGFVATDYSFVSELDIGAQVALGPPPENSGTGARPPTSSSYIGTDNDTRSCYP